jgi:hypothetical protein
MISLLWWLAHLHVAGQQLFQVGSAITESVGVVADINPVNSFPRDANGSDMPQSPQLSRVNDALARVTTTLPASATVTPVTVTFTKSSGDIDHNMLDYKTKAGEELYKLATMLLYESYRSRTRTFFHFSI